MKAIKRVVHQAAIVGLLFAFMLVTAMAILTRPLLKFIEIGVNATFNVTNGSLMQQTIEIIPVFMWLVVLVGVVVLITGARS